MEREHVHLDRVRAAQPINADAYHLSGFIQCLGDGWYTPEQAAALADAIRSGDEYDPDDWEYLNDTPLRGWEPYTDILQACEYHTETEYTLHVWLVTAD